MTAPLDIAHSLLAQNAAIGSKKALRNGSWMLVLEKEQLSQVTTHSSQLDGSVTAESTSQSGAEVDWATKSKTPLLGSQIEAMPAALWLQRQQNGTTSAYDGNVRTDTVGRSNVAYDADSLSATTLHLPTSIGSVEGEANAADSTESRLSLARRQEKSDVAYAKSQMHVFMQDGKAQVWIRDTRLSYRAIASLEGEVRTKLDKDGVMLVDLRINGKKVVEYLHQARSDAKLASK